MPLFLAVNQLFSVVWIPINYVVLPFCKICFQTPSGILISYTVHIMGFNSLQPT